MRMRDDALIGLRVETVAGTRVGRLVGFVMDVETGFVTQYRVRPKGIVAACFPGIRELLIAHAQVISLDTKRMIVRDDAATVASGGARKRLAPSMSPQPLTIRET